MTTRTSIRWWVSALCGSVTVCAALCGATAASAAVGLSVTPAVPSVVQVGGTVAATLTITNQNTAPQAAFSNTIGTVTFVPSCGFRASGGDCPVGFRDPGSLVPSASGRGRVASACAGQTFTISVLDMAQGKYVVAPQSPVVLTAPGSGATATCIIDFTADATRIPADANASVAGAQTEQLAYADAMAASGGGSATGTGSDELRVDRGLPSMTTQSDPAQLTLGASFNDTATLAFTAGAAIPTGTVRFDVFTAASGCQGTPVLTSTNNLNGAGTNAISGPLAPTAAGTYRVVATYLGDVNYNSAVTACDDPAEAVTVASASPPPPAPPPAPPPPPPIAPASVPVISTIASAGIVLGGQIRDSATVSGRTNPTAGATVEFRLYGPGDATCATIPAFLSTAPVSDVGVATSAFFTPTRPGVYRWRAFYSGDANNVAVATRCNGANETVSVATPDAPQITNTSFEAPPRVGQPALLTVQAVDPQEPISGMQVDFGEASGLAGVSACRARTLGPFFPSPATLKLPRTFLEAGEHDLTIEVLSGQCTGALRRSATTMRVDVLPATGTRQTPRGVTSARAAASPSSCKDRFLSPTSAATRSRVAAAVLCLVNVERAKQGRKKLARSPRLQLAAGAHASDMVRRKYFEHERVPGGPKLASRLRKAGYRGSAYAENIGYGSNYNATLMVAAWMASPGQRANILQPRVRFAGVGVTPAIPLAPQRPGSTYTVDFGTTAS